MMTAPVFGRQRHLRIARGQLDRLQCELEVKITQVQFRFQGRAERGKDLFLVELQKRDTQTQNWCWIKRKRVKKKAQQRERRKGTTKRVKKRHNMQKEIKLLPSPIETRPAHSSWCQNCARHPRIVGTAARVPSSHNLGRKLIKTFRCLRTYK